MKARRDFLPQGIGMWGICRKAMLLLACTGCLAAGAQSPAMPAMPGMSDEGMDHATMSMSHRHMDMGPHMKMTPLRPLRPGDREKADEIVAAARAAIEPYRDYRVALADGYQIFLPNLKQPMYHFTKNWYAVEAAFHFNADHPTSLLYEKTKDGYKLIGAMYTAPANTGLDELDSRVPLSVAQWHEHINFCQAPPGKAREYFGAHPRFGLRGSITTREDCEAAGGKFKPQIFGWMVHVYPFEKSEDAVWSVERQVQ